MINLKKDDPTIETILGAGLLGFFGQFKDRGKHLISLAQTLPQMVNSDTIASITDFVSELKTLAKDPAQIQDAIDAIEELDVSNYTDIEEWEKDMQERVISKIPEEIGFRFCCAIASSISYPFSIVVSAMRVGISVTKQQGVDKILQTDTSVAPIEGLLYSNHTYEKFKMLYGYSTGNFFMSGKIEEYIEVFTAGLRKVADIARKLPSKSNKIAGSIFSGTDKVIDLLEFILNNSNKIMQNLVFLANFVIKMIYIKEKLSEGREFTKQACSLVEIPQIIKDSAEKFNTEEKIEE
jgi:hypothetical protein